MVQHADIDHTGITGSGGSVATDAIWDAAGDLAVGSGANTAAKLTIGAVGGHLSRINGAVAWDSGTSNPGSAVAGDRYYRSDLREPIVYDGTRWLSMPEDIELSTTEHLDGGTTDNVFKMAGLPGDFAVYLEAAWVFYLNAGTNNGTNFWTFQFGSKASGSGATTNRGATVNTSGGTSGQWNRLTPGSFGIALTTSDIALICLATKTLTPGGLYWRAKVRTRRIIT